MTPIRPDLDAGLWYFYYFLTERGRAGLEANSREIARVIWTRNSPAWQFDEATPNRAAVAFDNPDYVEVVLHSHRHRLGFAAGAPTYHQLEEKLSLQPPITVPAVTLDGLADGNFPATDGSGSAHHFTGPRVHYQVPGAGHNLPQESPDAFADAIVELANLKAPASEGELQARVGSRRRVDDRARPPMLERSGHDLDADAAVARGRSRTRAAA